MTYTFYSPESKQWVELTDEEAQTPEAKQYHPVPLDETARGFVRYDYGLKPVRGAMPDMLTGDSSLSAYRPTGQEDLPQGSAGAEALPFRIRQGGSFTNIHAARAFKDANPKAGEIEVRVYDPTERQNTLWSFKPLSELEKRKGDKNIIATMGETGLGFPVYRDLDEGIKKQVDQKVAQGGFGAADTAKVVGYNFLEGISPFGTGLESIPGIRNTMDVNRAYNQVETDSYNADPYYTRTALTTVLPQIAGGLSPAGGSALARKVGANKVANTLSSTGANIVTNPSSVALDALKAGAQRLPEAVKNRVARSLPGRVFRGTSSIPLVRSLAGTTTPIAKGVATGVGDTALSGEVADLARDEDTPIDGVSYLTSGGLSALTSIPAAVLGYKGAAFKNKLEASTRYDQNMRDKVKGDPNTAAMYDDFTQSVTDASKLTLPGETPLQPATLAQDAKGRPIKREMDFFEQEGVHRPEVVKARLSAHGKKLEDLGSQVNQRIEEEIPKLQVGLRKTIPEYTAAATEKQKYNFTRSPDEQGLVTNYDNTPAMVGDFAYTLADTLDRPGAGKTRRDIENEVANFVQEEGLVSPQQKLQKATEIPFEGPSLRAAIPPIESQGGSALKTIPTKARNPQVQVPPAPFAQPIESINTGLMPKNNTFDQLADETPLTGRSLRPDIPEEQWAAKRVGIPNKRNAALAEAVLRKQQQNMPEQFPVAAPLPTTGRVGGIPMPNDPVMGSRYGGKGLSPTYPSKDAGTFSAVPERSYSEADFVPYEKIQELNMLGNKAWAERQGTRQTPYEAVTSDAVRRASRQIMTRAFGSEWEVPQEAKKLALDVQDAVMGMLDYQKGTPARDIELRIPEHAPKVLNMIKATIDMGKKAAGNADKDDIAYRNLQQALSNLQLSGYKGLREGIDTRVAGKPVDMSPVDAVTKFNQETQNFLTTLRALVARQDTLKNDANYKELKSIVDNKWSILEELTKDVTANDLNDMGRLMREYVIWNQFVSNIPGLGGIGKVISSLQMLSQSGSILSRDKTHIATSKLDSIWIAKHAQKLIDKFQNDLQRVQAEVEKATRLWNLRNVGRMVTAGGPSGEDTKDHKLPKDVQYIVDYMQEEYQKDIQAQAQAQESLPATETPAPQNNVERVFNAILSAPIDQQEKVYDDALASGQLTEAEIEELNGKIQQSGD